MEHILKRHLEKEINLYSEDTWERTSILKCHLDDSMARKLKGCTSIGEREIGGMSAIRQ